MFKILSIFFVIITCVWAKSTPIKLAPLPMSSAIQTTKVFSPFARYVSKVLQKDVELVHFTNYDEILKALSENSIDLAYLGPLPFASYKHKYKNAKPLVGFLEKDGSKGYRCVLIGTSFDTIDFNNLIGKKIALTQPLSTCGYFLTSQLFKKLSHTPIQKMKFRYLKKHTLVADSVIRGEYLLGGVKDSVANEYKNLGLIVFEQSQKLPGFILVANTNTLKKETINHLQKQLLKTKKEEFSKWGSKISHGLYKAKDSDFDVIEKALIKMKIPQKGNF